jgi:hypothetical protein
VSLTFALFVTIALFFHLLATSLRRGGQSSPAPSGALSNSLLCLGVGASASASIDIKGLVEVLVETVDITVISLGSEVGTLVIDLDLGLGDDLYAVVGLVEEIEEAVNVILSRIFGTPVSCRCNKKHSSSHDVLAVELGLHVNGLTDGGRCSSLDSQVNIIVGRIVSVFARLSLHVSLDLQIAGWVKA